MVSFMATAFFCIAEKGCFFWNSSELHMSEAKCRQELAKVEEKFASNKIEAALSCLRVNLGKEA